MTPVVLVMIGLTDIVKLDYNMTINLRGGICYAVVTGEHPAIRRLTKQIQ